MLSLRLNGLFWFTYARCYDAIWDSPLTSAQAEVVAGLARGRKVVEVGCGTGLFAKELRREGRHVVAVDTSPAMVRSAWAHSRCDSAVQSSAERLPFASDSIDTVILANVLHVVQSPSAVVAEALRIAVPGGVVVVLWPFDDLHPRSIALLERQRGRSRVAALRANLLRFLIGVPGVALRVRRHRDQLLRLSVGTTLAGSVVRTERNLCGCLHLIVIDVV